MKSALAVPVFAALFLAGCGAEPSTGGGGIETGDIQCLVLDGRGAPAPGARVWLVDASSDSVPATVLDSAVSGPDGVARLRKSAPSRTSGLRFDARRGDSLAIAAALVDTSLPGLVRLRPSGTAIAWSDSSDGPPLLFAPGSHFRSVPSSDGARSTLSLPTDAPILVWKTSRTVRLVALGQLKTTPDPRLRWSLRNLLWDDTLQVKTVLPDSVLFRSLDLPSPASWRILDTVDTAGLWVASNASTGTDHVRFGTSTTGAGSAIETPVLPDSGALAFRFADSGRCIRRFVVSDPDGTPVAGILANPDASRLEFVDTRTLSTEFYTDTAALSRTGTKDWVVTWDPKYVRILVGRTPVAVVYRPTSGAGGVRIRFGVLPASPGAPGLATLDSLRWYRPP